MTGQQHDGLRADARQNRQLILEAAREALAASADASLNSIAKKAGVGPGTLYRHFRNREALVLAVYRYDVQELADAAPKLLADHPPIEALRLWFDRLAHYSMIRHGLADVLHSATSDGLAGETYEPVLGAITHLLQACADDCSIRAGCEPDDVLLLLGFLWRIDPGPGADAKAARLLDLVMNGLRSGAANKPRLGVVTGSARSRSARRARRAGVGKQGRRLSALSMLRIPAALRTAAGDRSSGGQTIRCRHD